ncbi:hypothetical protein Hdeb2414_s0007g00249131 [Helianthus debilis subsp. tardiflorus]
MMMGAVAIAADFIRFFILITGLMKSITGMHEDIFLEINFLRFAVFMYIMLDACILFLFVTLHSLENVMHVGPIFISQFGISYMDSPLYETLVL